MTTSNKIISFLKSFQSINRYHFDYTFDENSVVDEFVLEFEFSVQCAMFYSLLHDMLIENTSIYLENSNTVRILVIKFDKNA